MSTVFQKALKLLVGDASLTDLTHFPIKKSSRRPLNTMSERELIKLESEIGADVFGPLPPGVKRQFFCLDDTTWIWYEEWTGKDHKQHSSTIRYEVHDKGIFKVQEGARYSYIEGDELRNFIVAIKLYYEQIARHIYHLDPVTGKKLV